MSSSTGVSNGGGGGGGGIGKGLISGGINSGASGFVGSMVGGGSTVSNGSPASSSSSEVTSHSFESRIDKMRRFISSPLTRRKSTSQASTESAPPLISSSFSSNSSSSSSSAGSFSTAKHSSTNPEHHQKIFGTPIEKLTHQRSFNEMSSSSMYPYSSSANYHLSCTSSSTHHLSTSSYSSTRSMSTSGLPGSILFTSSSNSSSPSSSTINLAPSSTLGQGTVLTLSTNSPSSNSSSKKVIYDKEATVPFVITRLCHYIEDSQGLMQEGLFRTSGNARLIEKLKTSFDSNGDAPLETEGDIPSAAALLKLFLRELPVPLIPQSIHCLFLDTVQDTLNQATYDKDTFIGRIKTLVENLPDENYFLLKYLARFLHQVARHESFNRMNPSSLGIIFGPNIFRVAAEDYRGLREQSLTNQVVTFFITDYETIFGYDLSPENNDQTNIINHLPSDHTSGDPSQGRTSVDPKEESVDSPENEKCNQLEEKKKEKKLITVSIESSCKQIVINQREREREDEETPLSINMTREDDVDDLLDEAESKVIKDSTDSSCTPLQIDIPPIDCEPSDSSSISPTLACSSISPCPVDAKDYLLSLDSIAKSSDETSPTSTLTITTTATTTKTTTAKPSEGVGKRKDRKSILLSSSSLSSSPVRSSSEERKPINSSYRTHSESLTDQSNQDVRRCNSYQDLAKGGTVTVTGTPYLKHRQLIKSCNLSSDSVTQSPEPKRREIDAPKDDYNITNNKAKGKLSRSTLSFESRPNSLDLSSGKSHLLSCESKSEPTIRGKCSTSLEVQQSSNGDKNHHHHYHHHQPLLSSLSSSSSTTYYSKDTTNPGKSSQSSQPSSSSPPQQQPPSFSSSSAAKIATIKKASSLSYSSVSSLPHIDLNALHKNAEGESAMVSDLRYSWSSTNESESIESLLDEGRGEERKGDEDEGGDDSVNRSDENKSLSDSQLREGVKSSEPTVQNAAIQILRRRNTYEAPLSPSAYRGLLGQRAPHLDHTIPPSPPGEQDHHGFHGSKVLYNQESTAVKEAKRKIHNLKRRLKQFERDFEKETGYRPSHEQKMKSDVAQPLLFELNKFRKMLREYKEDARMTFEFYEGVFNEMQRSLKERRYVVGRPETIEEMSIDQIFEEKLDLQKSLLKYESVFGRPCRREDRAVMKPLYDRYRTIRNLVSKIPKNKETTDLQPILEHVAMNFSSPSHSPKDSLDVKDDDEKGANGDNDDDDDDTDTGDINNNVQKPFTDKKGGNDRDNENDSNNANQANTNSNNNKADDNNNQVDDAADDNSMKADFTGNNNNNNSNNKKTQPKPEAVSKIKLKESTTTARHFMKTISNPSTINETIDSLLLNQQATSHNRNLWHNLHELPPGELFKELALVRREKTELRKIIRSFEDEFYRAHGRKVNELEKSQLESVYNNYKACKKKLRLLEVFIEKYEKRKMES